MQPLGWLHKRLCMGESVESLIHWDEVGEQKLVRLEILRQAGKDIANIK